MIRFDNVTKAYPDGTKAVEGFNLEAPTGQLTVMVGPSGCGKTTALRMVNRLIEPTSGTIYLDNQLTSRMDTATLRRRIGYVIQNAGLFPHRTVVENVATMPVLLGEKRRTALIKAQGLLETVGLDASSADKYPWQLSGGQQQRVGVARALAADPSFMLMDEPFSAVDPIVRAQLQDEFLRLQGDIGKTIIMVTHDIDEALKLGDKVAVMRMGGEVVQLASPAELLTNPVDEFVADFVGRDRGYRALGFVGTHEKVQISTEPSVCLGATAAEAQREAISEWLLVLDERQRPQGWVMPDQIFGTVTRQDLNLSGTSADVSGSLRHMLDAALSAPSRRGVIVGENGALVGTATASAVVKALEATVGSI